MATDVGDHLGRFVGPGLLGVVDLAVVNLRMGHEADDARLDTLLIARQARQEGSLVVVVEGTAEGVTKFVAKGGYARHLADVGLGGKAAGVDGAGSRTPSLTIDEDGGVYLLQLLAQEVHRLDVVATHEIDTETINVVLLGPILHALDHKLPHQGLLRGRLVAAARAVGGGAVGTVAVVGLGEGAVEVAALQAEGVVIDHVEDHADARLVEGLHHLLELQDATGGQFGIEGVAALGHVVVERIVAPVVLGRVVLGLVDRGEVVGRQDVDGIDAQGLEMGDGLLLRQGEKLALVDQS